LALCICVYLIFFFQAEDGIRDFHVTGVQTCALPICKGYPDFKVQLARLTFVGLRYVKPEVPTETPEEVAEDIIAKAQNALFQLRSEERRVGKELRSRGTGHTCKQERHKQRQIKRHRT